MSRITDSDFIFNYDDLTEEELIEILSLYQYAHCSDWETDFCRSLVARLQGGKQLTERQVEILNRGLLTRLQDNDPLLWDLPRANNDN